MTPTKEQPIISNVERVSTVPNRRARPEIEAILRRLDAGEKLRVTCRDRWKARILVGTLRHRGFDTLLSDEVIYAALPGRLFDTENRGVCPSCRHMLDWRPAAEFQSAGDGSETPEELTNRVDRLYLELAAVYVKIGRMLGIDPRKRGQHGTD